MKILIWGFGLEGRSSFDYFSKKNNVDIYVTAKEKINLDNAKFINENEIENYNFDLVIKSSGVSFYKEEVRKVLLKGTKITSNLNIFLENNKSKTIAITGTKGKSTTSSILYHILSNLGFKTALVGNIGKSFLDIIDEKYDYVVLELSSYQIKTLHNYVDYGIILNLFKEHLDWHLTHENYFNDKLELSKYSKIFIYNSNDDIISKNLKIKDNFICFNDKNGFNIKDNFICFKDEKLKNINNFNNIVGNHIFRNICSILTFIKKENLDLEKSIDILKTFRTLQHRLEVFYNQNNTLFIDDSISTIPEATIESIKTYNNKNVFLVLGGYNRNQDYTELIDFIKNSKNIKKIFLIGQTGLILKDKFNNCNYYNSMEELVNSIKSNNLINTTVILSPASPSYDMFNSFEERGNLFKKLMLKNL